MQKVNLSFAWTWGPRQSAHLVVEVNGQRVKFYVNEDGEWLLEFAQAVSSVVFDNERAEVFSGYGTAPHVIVMEPMKDGRVRIELIAGLEEYQSLFGDMDKPQCLLSARVQYKDFVQASLSMLTGAKESIDGGSVVGKRRKRAFPEVEFEKLRHA